MSWIFHQNLGRFANHSLIFLAARIRLPEHYDPTKSVKAGLSPREPILGGHAPGYRPSGSPNESCRPDQRGTPRAARCLYLLGRPWHAALRTDRSSQPWDQKEVRRYTLG